MLVDIQHTSVCPPAMAAAAVASSGSSSDSSDIDRMASTSDMDRLLSLPHVVLAWIVTQYLDICTDGDGEGAAKATTDTKETPSSSIAG